MEISHDYDDIIHMERPVSGRHPRMSMRDRAAQFASFKALSGYEEEIGETARITDRRPELDEDQKQLLDLQLRRIRALLDGSGQKAEPSEASDDSAPGPAGIYVTVTWFQPDERKDGGTCCTVYGHVRAVDSFRHILILEDHDIPLEDILALDPDPQISDTDPEDF